MKKAALVFVFIATFCWAVAPSPDDYPLTIHVSSSQRVVKPNAFSGNYTVQVLQVVINGKKYELEASENRSRLLALGDYKARLIKDEHKTTYESFRVFERLFPDQTTREFTVVGQSE